MRFCGTVLRQPFYSIHTKKILRARKDCTPKGLHFASSLPQ